MTTLRMTLAAALAVAAALSGPLAAPGAATAPAAAAKSVSCKAPKVKLGRLCVNAQIRAANGSSVVLGLVYGRGKPKRIVSVTIRKPLTVKCSDGSTQQIAFLVGASPITGPSFSGTTRTTSSAGQTVTVLKGRFTTGTRAVIDTLSQTFPKPGGVTCTVAARNVVIRQGR